MRLSTAREERENERKVLREARGKLKHSLVIVTATVYTQDCSRSSTRIQQKLKEALAVKRGQG